MIVARRLVRTAALLAVVAAVPAAARAQDDTRSEPFSWRGPAAAGSWLTLRNVNGSVRIEGTSGGQVEVQATKRWRRGDPRSVQVRVTRYGAANADVLVCAVWEGAECDERGYRSRDDRGRRERDHDVSVDFVVRLPRGVHVSSSTVNGSLRVADVSGEVRATTVNGGIEARSTGGPVSATTVNGDVDARMTTLGDRDVRFTTVNGSVTVSLPERLDADIEMTTVNGSLHADYPLTMTGRINPRRIRATVGRGGPRLQFTTVNGSVTLRKGA